MLDFPSFESAMSTNQDLDTFLFNIRSNFQNILSSNHIASFFIDSHQKSQYIFKT